jgi:hypothetical protein
MKLEIELEPSHEKTIKDIIDNNEIKRIILTSLDLEVTTKSNSVHTFPVKGFLNE